MYLGLREYWLFDLAVARHLQRKRVLASPACKVCGLGPVLPQFSLQIRILCHYASQASQFWLQIPGFADLHSLSLRLQVSQVSQICFLCHCASRPPRFRRSAFSVTTPPGLPGFADLLSLSLRLQASQVSQICILCHYASRPPRFRRSACSVTTPPGVPGFAPDLHSLSLRLQASQVSLQICILCHYASRPPRFPSRSKKRRDKRNVDL